MAPPEKEVGEDQTTKDKRLVLSEEFDRLATNGSLTINKFADAANESARTVLGLKKGATQKTTLQILSSCYKNDFRIASKGNSEYLVRASLKNEDLVLNQAKQKAKQSVKQIAKMLPLKEGEVKTSLNVLSEQGRVWLEIAPASIRVSARENGMESAEVSNYIFFIVKAKSTNNPPVTVKWVLETVSLTFNISPADVDNEIGSLIKNKRLRYSGGGDLHLAVREG